jgi:nephrocystin-3
VQTIKVFLSSTFQDFEEERRALTRWIVPDLRERFALHGVNLICVDLNWGVTLEESRTGQAIGRCLQSIDDCRPYFVGLLGRRYGWVPRFEDYATSTLERFPWLRPHAGQVSVTELEIRHGVLNGGGDLTKALFFFETRRGFFDELHGIKPKDEEDEFQRDKLDRLKCEIRERGVKIVEYANQREFVDFASDALYKCFSRSIAAPAPAVVVPPAELRNYRAKISQRRLQIVYVPAKETIGQMSHALRAATEGIVVTGPVGIGKSALLANLSDIVAGEGIKARTFTHIIGTVRRVDEVFFFLERLHIFARNELAIEVSGWDSTSLLLQFDQTLVARKLQLTIVLDGIDRLDSESRLQWLPAARFEAIRWVIGLRECPSSDTLIRRGWGRIEVADLSLSEREELISRVLALRQKRLSPGHLARVRDCAPCGNPLFLLQVLQELCEAADFESLERKLDDLLSLASLSELYKVILQRRRLNFIVDEFKDYLGSILVSANGILEADLADLAGISVSTIEAMTVVLGNAVEGGGELQLRFANPAIEEAVQALFFASPTNLQAMHIWHAAWYEKLQPGAQRTAELPWHLARAGRASDLVKFLTSSEIFGGPGATLAHAEKWRYWRHLGVTNRDELTRIYRTAWQAWQSIHEAGQLGELARSLASFLSSTERPDPDFASELGMFSVRIAENATPRDERELAAALNDLGVTLMEVGRLHEARDCLNRAAEIVDRPLTSSDPELVPISVFSNLGAVCLQLGLPEEAERFFLKDVEGRRALGGSHLRGIGTTLNNLGRLYEATSRLGKAREVFNEALNMRLRFYGPDTDAVAQCHLNLGMLHLRLGELGEAEALLTQSLKTRLNVLQPDNPDLSRSALWLGLVFYKQGRLLEAQKILQNAYKVLYQTLGEHSESTRMAAAALMAIQARS